MLVFEFKAYGKPEQFQAITEAIRTTQFIRNKCLRLWQDAKDIGKSAISRYCAVLAQEFPFAAKLNSMARQAAAERAWLAISRFYDNCKHSQPGKKAYPRFQKDCRSVEYKTSGWKLAGDRKSITFSDKMGIGKLKLKGTRDLNFYQVAQIKRVRLVSRADGFYVQFCIKVNRVETLEPTGEAIGLDVGLTHFYTDTKGETVDNPRFLRAGEQGLKAAQRQVSRKKKGSSNRRKARVVLGKRHLKISRQRKDHAVKLARCVIKSNDFVAYENLSIKNMVKNHCLAKSINDASWYMFRKWLEYFGKIFGKVTVAIDPKGTSQECSSCGATVKKSLSTRTHICLCGCELDRDENAARNILSRGLNTVGHTEINAWGERAATLAGVNLLGQAHSLNQESQSL